MPFRQQLQHLRVVIAGDVLQPVGAQRSDRDRSSIVRVVLLWSANEFGNSVRHSSEPSTVLRTAMFVGPAASIGTSRYRIGLDTLPS